MNDKVKAAAQVAGKHFAHGLFDAARASLAVFVTALGFGLPAGISPVEVIKLVGHLFGF